METEVECGIHKDFLITPVLMLINRVPQGDTHLFKIDSNIHSSHPYLSLCPSISISLADELWDPTDLIRRKGTPFEAMTGCTAPSSDALLAEVFWGFPQL